MKNIQYLILFTILFLNDNFVYSQLNLSYPIKNYSTDDYMAGTQNWHIVELEDGTICFANNDGLLAKNGNDWYVYQTPKKQLLRVLLEYQNKIYVGGGEDFGYFTKDFSGYYRYTSLTDKVSTKWGEIWRIKVLNDKVYLQGGKAIFVFDTNNDRLLNQIKSDQFIYFTIVDDQLILQSKDGFYSMDENFDSKTSLCNREQVERFSIREILNIKGVHTLFTLSNGIYQLENSKITSCNKPIQNKLINAQIYSVIDVNNKILVGTVLDGLYILDYDLNIIKHINSSSGLRNNTILSLGVDHNSNIWVGFDNGIGFIDINTRCLFYDFDKEIGSGYASFKDKEYAYWGTNQALFYTKENQPSNQINLIPDTQGQVWCLKKIGDQVFCGHHNGLFQIKENKAILLDATQGVMNIIRLSNNSDFYFLRCYHHLLLYKYSQNNFIKVSEITSPINIPRDIKLDKDNQIWSTDGDSIYRFKIDTNRHCIDRYISYSYPGDKHIFSYGGNILLWYQGDLLQYNAKEDRFTNDGVILEYSEENKHELIELFYCLPNDVFYKKVKGCEAFIGDLSKVKNQMQWNVQMASYYPNYYILNGKNGFINFDFSKFIDPISQIKVVLSEIKIKSKSDLEYQWIESKELEYGYNNIRFKFSSNDNFNIEYQYKLIGYDENYSLFSTKNVKEYTNLPEGLYRFEIRARDNNGNISECSTFEFIICPPFYRSSFAKVVCVFLLIIALIILFLTIKYLLKRKEKQLDLIRQKEIEELEKNYKIDNLSKERTIILIDKERLEESIAHKQRELTNSTHNVIVKNNLLMDIKDHLQSIYKEKNIDLRDSKLSKIFNLIDSNVNNEEDWAVFENYFSEIHQNFLDNLKKDFPAISATDLKLCAYIRLNKSTKEIASLMNITIRGVETSRYRLRKKLNLDRNGNIYDLLAKY